jgi:hypothetical protein
MQIVKEDPRPVVTAVRGPREGSPLKPLIDALQENTTDWFSIPLADIKGVNPAGKRAYVINGARYYGIAAETRLQDQKLYVRRKPLLSVITTGEQFSGKSNMAARAADLTSTEKSK